MQKFKLYSEEKNIIKISKEILKDYGNSNKELFQKENELFHLLCFFNLDNKLELLKNIMPNEPGDFLLNFKNKKILIEIAECFGNQKTYEYINNQLNILYDRKNKDKYCGDYKFSIDEVKTKLKDILIEKNNKNYNKYNEYDKIILLIVTGEYYNCPVTGNWLVKFLSVEDIEKSMYTIYVLNYFASSKDDNPIIIKNIKNEIIEYQNYLQKNK